MVQKAIHIFAVNAENFDESGQPTGTVDAFRDLLIVDVGSGTVSLIYGSDDPGMITGATLSPGVIASDDQVVLTLSDVRFDLDGNGKVDSDPANEHLKGARATVLLNADGSASLTSLSDELMNTAGYTPAAGDPWKMPEEAVHALAQYMSKRVYDAEAGVNGLVVDERGDLRTFSNLDLNGDGGEDAVHQLYAPQDSASPGVLSEINYVTETTPYASIYPMTVDGQPVLMPDGAPLQIIEGPGAMDIKLQQVIQQIEGRNEGEPAKPAPKPVEHGPGGGQVDPNT
jgi:hypothetical protein